MEYTIIAVQALGSFANWEKKASPMLARKSERRDAGRLAADRRCLFLRR